MALWKPIPGETPIEDISGLLVKSITLRSELDTEEAGNILEAALAYFTGKLTRAIAPFDYAWALRLHKEMFGKVWSWAGTLRKSDTNIGVPYHRIEQLLYQLMENLPYWNSEPLLKQAAMLHHQAVSIHPFPNGNGQWSRMLGDIWLRLHAHPFPAWPAAEMGKVSPVRAEYLAALQAADNGDYDPLVQLYERFVPRT